MTAHWLANTLDLDYIDGGLTPEERQKLEDAYRESAEALIKALEAYELADEAPKAYVVVDSSNGSVFKNGNISTTLTARVFTGKGEVDISGTELAYVWSKVNDDGTPDTAWNTLHAMSAKSITITDSDVWRRSTFTVSIEPIG